jgi:hypothetical protein
MTFLLLFMLDPGTNPVPEPECIAAPVPLRQKLAVSAVPVLVPAPVPQHWNESHH